jgi:hypothetical protein
MSKLIVILTEAEDIHAYAVAEALRIKGAEVALWHTTDFPSRSTETFRFETDKLKISIAGADFQLTDARPVSVWRRRPAHVVPEASLHPADWEFAEIECTVFRRSALSIFAQDAFWVNPPDAANRASRKILQHKLALEVGLAVPDTVYTNDPQEIRSFIHGHGGRAIYKPFRGSAWRSHESSWVPFTSEITEATLVHSDLLQLVPGIYQDLVPKAFELRITVMGHQAFTAKLLSQETESGRLDWRKAYQELRMEPWELPSEIRPLCIDLMRRLGIVFGCFDFVVRPDGKIFFLEVNEMGQFLFVEHLTALPLLDSFSDFLLAGQADFVWSRREPTVRYSEVLERAESAAKESTKLHVVRPEKFSWEESPAGKTSGTSS